MWLLMVAVLLMVVLLLEGSDDAGMNEMIAPYGDFLRRILVLLQVLQVLVQILLHLRSLGALYRCY